MATTINIEYCGIPGTGPTVTAAKQDAARKLSALVSDLSRAPFLVAVEGQGALVWRDVYGWTYRLCTDSDGRLLDGYSHTSTGTSDTYQQAAHRARSHLVQNAWRHAIEDDSAWLAAIPGLTDAERDEHRLYFAWQRRYKAARDAGSTDGEAHQIAGSLHQ